MNPLHKISPCFAISVPRFTSWAPGLAGPEDWREWAGGGREIEKSKTGPPLEFTDPLFRRRLSQVSRMTIQVLHDLAPFSEQTKIVFVSFRGEIAQQFKINRMLVEEGGLSPAAFSQSVFNTPPALAAAALNLRAGYSALYPGKDLFRTGFLAAAAAILSGTARESVLVYADELCPSEYGRLCPEDKRPLAFAALLCAQNEGRTLHISPGAEGGEDPLVSPEKFIAYLWSGT
ncbi:MAG: beta-ketoacyl synthase chain length factor [Treponema sp.]|jgi:hypothetical protein|nr:beta-ketoacyl synthase chain length factor [Treponema sp.]